MTGLECGTFDYQLGLDAAQDGTGGTSPGVTAGAAGSSMGGVSGSATGGVAGVAVAGAAGSGATAGSPLPGPVGWAALIDCGSTGTNGGEGGPTIAVTNTRELDEALNGEGRAIVEVSGTIDLGQERFVMTGSDKTLVGVGVAELVGAFRVQDTRNVILKNIKFNGAPTSGDFDAVEVSGATCVWIDHCEIFDGEDGNLDIVRGSNLVTVSWSMLYYAAKNHDHRSASNCGSTDLDTPGKLNITFHHNWWGAGILRYMPRVRHGQVHVFNNYYTSTGNDSCIGAGYMSRLLVENNVFEGVNDPLVFRLDEEVEGSGIHTAEVVERGNITTNTTGATISRGASFEPPYDYVLDGVEAARQYVISGAGVQ